MQFTKLRLEGFKSFVDPTELVIESGLTGVVGPNGCGKSNLLEALRWVMGESRARQMRGDGMEDVIFAGAEGRPARARAHVELVIDNTAATAPLAWREQPLLEITRRIVRDTGSDYRVNGKSVRARDVQMLFADAATGAASPALVRQGQIAELINAKPKARRRILEDAAGISGLYQRRHESLLKLRDAETNLSRIDDVLEAMAQQLAALERQAGAARRYRALAAELRTAEETLLQVRHARAAATHDTALRGRAEALCKLARAETEGQAAERAQEAAEAALEPVREEETIAAALLQRLTIERERLDERAETAEGEITSVRAMMRELEEDRAREARLAEDAAAATDRLSQAEADLDRAAEGAEERIEAAREKARQASEAQRAADEALDAASARAAEAAAAHESAQRRFADAAAAAERAQAQHTRLSNEAPGVAEAASAASTAAKEANAEAQAAAATLAEAEEALADASRNRSTTLERQDTTARDRAAAEAALAAVSAERRGLERLVGRDRAQTGLIDQLSVDPGWEAALGAALGDDLELAVLSEHPSAPATGWHPEPAKHDAHRLKTAVALDRLESFVAAPPALTQRLSAIWVVEAADGGALQASLPPGGRLVSREGDLWRWDGLCRRAADAPSAAALRLTQLNRLKALQKDESGALETFETADNAARDAAEASTEAGRVEALSRQSRNEAATEANEAARRAAKAGIAEDEASARERAHQEACAKAASALEEAQHELEELRTEAAAIEDPAAAQAAVTAAREAAAEARRSAAAAETAAGDELRAARGRARRRNEIAAEAAQWRNRANDAGTRSADLARRAEAAAERLRRAEEAPSAIEADRARLKEALSDAEERRRKAADALGAAETTFGAARKQTRLAEGDVSEARAALAAVEARLEAAAETLSEAVSKLSEAGVEPAQPTTDEERPGIGALEAEISRLTRARDALGAVNLRADEDAAALREEAEALTAEKEDLEAAVQKLRQAVASLNREGRSRLVTAFEQVNDQFSTLFRTLFGGGEARLVMVEDEDPLEAGLEILCQPPGKKLASLSLLSGGEQTLTALSLIFAVFLCQPSPICVLDEVDAPLDDSNVDRFCNLLDTMRERTDTRFLIITHHPLTMARMDRLFGVTMVERGVSQLVSVDLAKAAAMVDG